MMHGDISNGFPPLVLVHLDVVSLTTQVTTKKFGGLIKRTVDKINYDRLMLSAVWRYSVNTNVVMELIDFGTSPKRLDDSMERLDELGGHPFRSTQLYVSPRQLMTVLPYRQDIVGVLDLPERGLSYGSRWIDLSRL